jgi:hypothetical protein
VPKFRKKPVVIEARRFVGTEVEMEDVAVWCDGLFTKTGGHYHCIIATLEGDMQGDVGDWIIKGVKGEFYPCKPDIFAATYEEVPDASS